MTMKRIEELDYYELLNLKPTASQEEIENAYLCGIASFHPESLASYGLLSDEERKIALARIEEAYQTLSHHSKKKKYDQKLFEKKDTYKEKAHFRKSTEKLQIEDGEKKKRKIREKWKRLFAFFKRSERKSEAGAEEKESHLSTQKNTPFFSGEYLQKVRQTRGLSLEEISRLSKMNISLLKALEEENFEALPKGVYVPKLLELYAHHLGLKHQKLA